MEKILEIDTSEHFIPRLAIVGYKKNEDYTDSYYFSFHQIVDENLSAGMPLTQETAGNIFNCLEKEINKHSFRGLIPKNLLHFGFKGTLSLVWVVFPKSCNLFFDSKTGISNGLYPIPKLVFALYGNTLKVFALKRNDSINDSTTLYNAPFLNVNLRGKVCMGSASINYDGFKHYEDIMGYVEKQFFNSVFTETHHFNIVQGNIVNVMNSLKNKKRFDDKILQSNNNQLKILYEN